MNRLLLSSHLLGTSLRFGGRIEGKQFFSSFQIVGKQTFQPGNFAVTQRSMSKFAKAKPPPRQAPRDLVLYTQDFEKASKAVKFRGYSIAGLIVIWGAFGYFTYDVLNLLTQRTKNVPLVDSNEISEKSKILGFYASIYRSVKRLIGGDDSSPIIKQSTLFSFVQGMMSIFFPLIGALFIFGHKTVSGHQVHKLTYLAPSGVRVETFKFFGGRQFREINCRDIEGDQYLPTPEGNCFRVSGDFMRYRVDSSGRSSNPQLLTAIMTNKLGEVNVSPGMSSPPPPPPRSSSVDPNKVSRPPKFKM